MKLIIDIKRYKAVFALFLIFIVCAAVFLFFSSEVTQVPNVPMVNYGGENYSIAITCDDSTVSLLNETSEEIYCKSLRPHFLFTIPGNVDQKNLKVSIGEYVDVTNDQYFNGTISGGDSALAIDFKNLLFPKEYEISVSQGGVVLFGAKLKLVFFDRFDDRNLDVSKFWTYATSSKGRFNNWNILNGALRSSPLPTEFGEVVSSLPFLFRFGNKAEFSFDFKPAPASSRLAFYFLEPNVAVILGHGNNNIQIIQEGRIVKQVSFILDYEKVYRIKITKDVNNYTLYISDKETQAVNNTALITFISSTKQNFYQFVTVGFTQWINSGGDVIIDNFTAVGERGGD